MAKSKAKAKKGGPALRSQFLAEGVWTMPHRALMHATGFARSQLGKPLIGVATSFTDIVPGHADMRGLERFIERGVAAGGGVPFLFGIPGICDGIAMGHFGMRYSLPSRELIADMVESIIRAHALDGVILLTSCDKITPGMLMAAARLDRPTVVVTAGPMLAGRSACPGDYEGQRLSLVRDTFEAWIKYAHGEIDRKQLVDLEINACPGAGSCQGLYTANTMNALTEALGMSLTGCGTSLAVSSKTKQIAYDSGVRVVDLVREGKTARQVMTRNAFYNAIRVDMATGGSTNTILHITAVAREAGIDIGLDLYDELSNDTPHIVSVRPGGEDFMEDLEYAGGVPALLNVLKPKLLDSPTVNKKSILQVAAAARPLDVEYLATREQDGTVRHHKRQVIRSLKDPIRPQGGITILRGNLAPDGAVIKSSAVEEAMQHFIGRARVFNSEQEAMRAIERLPKIMKKDEKAVLVIRYEGPRGGPGMPEMLSPTAALRGYPAELLARVALITDGRFSGGTRGPCVGHVAPEAIERGPIGLIEEGDEIEIDIPRHKLTLRVTRRELARRRKAWKPAAVRELTGYLARYARMIGPAQKGATYSE